MHREKWKENESKRCHCYVVLQFHFQASLRRLGHKQATIEDTCSHEKREVTWLKHQTNIHFIFDITRRQQPPTHVLLSWLTSKLLLHFHSSKWVVDAMCSVYQPKHRSCTHTKAENTPKCCASSSQIRLFFSLEISARDQSSHWCFIFLGLMGGGLATSWLWKWFWNNGLGSRPEGRSTSHRVWKQGGVALYQILQCHFICWCSTFFCLLKFTHHPLTGSLVTGWMIIYDYWFEFWLEFWPLTCRPTVAAVVLVGERLKPSEVNVLTWYCFHKCFNLTFCLIKRR